MDAYQDKNIHSGNEGEGYSTKDAQDIEAVVEGIDDFLAEYTQLRWEDLRFPATRVRQGALNKPDFDYTNVGLLFPQNDADEKIYISEQMPHAWAKGTAIRPHVHFIQDEADLPTWKLSYRFWDNGDAPSSFTTIEASTDVAFTYSSGSLTQIVKFDEISLSSLGTSALFDFILWREDDDVTGDVLMKTFDFHYQVDSLGSEQEYIKED